MYILYAAIDKVFKNCRFEPSMSVLYASWLTADDDKMTSIIKTNACEILLILYIYYQSSKNTIFPRK